MAFGYRKSFKLAPGLRMTLSKRGASVSGGPKGSKLSVNTRREKRAWFSWLGGFWHKRL